MKVLCNWLLVLVPSLATAQALLIQDAVRSFSSLSNTTVTMSNRAELRITAPGDPLPGCVIHLNSPDAALLLNAIAPSQAASTFLTRLRVNGANAVLDGNVRVVPYAQGTMVIPHARDFAAVEAFDGRHLTGRARSLHPFVSYNNVSIASFKLKRGYMATLAQEENGNGMSQCYVAQDGDLEVGRLPASLENNIRFVRIFPWRWTGKKGIAGDIESGLNLAWLYNWNISRNSSLNLEYVPIRQTRYWPGLDQDWQTRGATHLLGYNEPDRPDQANMSVADAIASWPDLLATGLRVGAPAVSDGGLGWLYDFMGQASSAGLRVDYVPVHYYRCYGNVGDPSGTANQFYNFLKGIYDVVKRPLWVTEWNNGANWTGCADPTFAQQEAAIQAMIDMLESTPFVERYALYNWVEDVRRVKWDDGSLTAAGARYRDKTSTLAYRQELPDSGIGSSGRYCFDGDTQDSSPNGHNAMRVGAPRFIPGKYDEAIALNGSTDYLQLSPRLADSTDWTFAGWVFWNGGANWQRIFDFGEDTSHYLFLTPRSSAGTLRFAIADGGSEQRLDASTLPIGVWTHLAVTIVGNTGKLFVNGVPVATNTSMSINPVDVGTKYNYLGRSQFPADPLFSGRFDDFRFISSGLTDAQIAAIMEVPPPRFSSRTIYLPDAAVDQPYDETIAGEAIGTGPLSFAKLGGPGWLSVSTGGEITGTPSPAERGVNGFLVSVTDTNGSLHTTRLFITVPGVIASIGSPNDDAEQAVSGTVTLDSTDLELVNDSATGSGDQLVGLRFPGLTIPRGAIITEASLRFTADESQNVPTALTIFAQASDNAASFSTAANNIGSRPRTPGLAWHPAPWTAGESGTAQLTPNLAAVVQDVTSRPGWSTGNALAFIITGAGHRTADAADKSGGSSPILSINYRYDPAVSTYLYWASNHSAGSPLADPDGDNYSNLMEYALGLDPAVADRDAIAFVVNGPRLELTYSRPTTITDLTYQVQYADAIDAANWSSSAVTQQIIADDGIRRTIRAIIPRGISGKRFVRLHISL